MSDPKKPAAPADLPNTDSLPYLPDEFGDLPYLPADVADDPYLSTDGTGRKP